MSSPTKSIQDLNRWARWGLSPSERDGYPVLTETGLWFLELRHPGVVEREGDDLYVTLDRTYLAIPVPDRAYLKLVPAPYHVRKVAAPPGPQDPASRA